MDLTNETPQETAERLKLQGGTLLASLTTYNVRGVTGGRQTASAIFSANGAPDCIREITTASALKMACRKGNTRGLLTREFKHHPNSPLSVQILEQRAGQGEAGDDFVCVGRVRIGAGTCPVTGQPIDVAQARPPEGETEWSSKGGRERAEEIADEATSLLTKLDATQLSKALADFLKNHCHAVQSMGLGNNYYVPPARDERAHSLLKAMSEKFDFYYGRDPKSSLGASHVGAHIAKAATCTVEEQLREMEAKVGREREAALTAQKDKGARGRSAIIGRAMQDHKENKIRLACFESMIEERYLKAIRERHAQLDEALAVVATGQVPKALPTRSDLLEPVPQAEPKAEPKAAPPTTGYMPDPIQPPPAGDDWNW